MGDDLIELAMSYVEDEPMNTIWQPINTIWQPISSTSYMRVEEPWTSISYQPPTEEERQAYERFVKRFVKVEQKRQEKEENYKQFKEFTRILERTYYN